MPTIAARVLGIDTSLRSTGVGVVLARGNRYSAVEYGTIKNPPRAKHSECLRRLHEGILEIIDRTRPTCVSIEGAFFYENGKTALILGEARGAVIAACAARALPIYEYAPRRVKQSMVGFGGAGKDQVGRMVMRILALSEPPQEDAADALALALCHLHTASTVAALAPETI